jgi:hypothetical protein
MNIIELIDTLQEIRCEHGDVHVSGITGYGQPEMTVESITLEPSRPLESAHPANEQDRLPERVLIARRTSYV